MLVKVHILHLTDAVHCRRASFADMKNLEKETIFQRRASVSTRYVFYVHVQDKYLLVGLLL